MSSGGWIIGPNADTDSVEVRLKGCSVHPQPHPRKLIRDGDGKIECNGEWILPPDAARTYGDRVLRELNLTTPPDAVAG